MAVRYGSGCKNKKENIMSFVRDEHRRQYKARQPEQLSNEGEKSVKQPKVLLFAMQQKVTKSQKSVCFERIQRELNTNELIQQRNSKTFRIADKSMKEITSKLVTTKTPSQKKTALIYQRVKNGEISNLRSSEKGNRSLKCALSRERKGEETLEDEDYIIYFSIPSLDLYIKDKAKTEKTAKMTTRNQMVLPSKNEPLIKRNFKDSRIKTNLVPKRLPPLQSIKCRLRRRYAADFDYGFSTQILTEYCRLLSLKTESPSSKRQ